MLNLLLSIGRYSILRQVVTAFNRDNLVITQKSPGPGVYELLTSWLSPTFDDSGTSQWSR